MTTTLWPDLPTDEEILLSRESGAQLSEHLDQNADIQAVGIFDEAGELETLWIPTAAYRVLIDALTQMALGNGVALIPVRDELTTQEAAFMLDVPHWDLVRLLASGALPFHEVNGQWRINYVDLARYKTLDGVTAPPSPES